MKKTFVLIALSLIFVMCMAPAAVIADYEGASSWAVPELDKAAGCGLITDRVMGDVSGNVTREEFAEIVVRMYELFTGKEAEAGDVSFTDTANKEIYKAANMGMVLGVGDGKFAPDNPVTREQMAVILLRTMKAMNPAADFSADGAEKFADDNMISAYARDGVYYSSKNGLLRGVGDNKFNPKGYSSREAAIIICLRAYEMYKQSSVPQTSASHQGPQAGPVFTNEILEQNIEKLDSYRRIIRTITPATATTSKWETIKEFAYIKNPVSRYMKLDFPDSGSYHEEIIIGGIMWNRISKDEAWTEWNEWYAEKPAILEYDLSTQPYPINYGKLTYTKAGTENINGINCIKYTVSGTYSEEFTDERSGDKYPITLSASGTIWIADDAAIKTAIIRQRIKVNTDIIYGVEKAIHAVSEDVIEDDVMDINSVKIAPPQNAIKGN